MLHPRVKMHLSPSHDSRRFNLHMHPSPRSLIAINEAIDTHGDACMYTDIHYYHTLPSINGIKFMLHVYIYLSDRPLMFWSGSTPIQNTLKQSAVQQWEYSR
jgi:hypothetical protein